ncbi:vacuolar protein-sorting protein-like protein [Sarcoptes scabiei]|uniref:Vacuolar protein-sorting protein-like protein n=1 Tax=Sarcoptes scabiei TaxID=52283 RepID=A0A132AJY3_SARSC|nr:vacuolar protein-sorting protein-like protein [Sarcoptes scabiei]
MFNEFCFSQLGDYQILNNVVQALHQFQKILGPLNLIVSKGRASELICNHLQKLNVFSGLIECSNSSEDYIIDLFVIDREEDYVSALLSQINYSGIIDETFGIECGKIRFHNDEKNCFSPSSKSSLDGSRIDENKFFKHNLMKNDSIFEDAKDRSFSAVCAMLKEKGQKLRQKSFDRQSMSLSEMQQFLRKEMNNLQSEHKLLFSHLTICEKVMAEKKLTKFSEKIRVEQSMIEGNDPKQSIQFIENGTIRLVSWPQTLRLICLYSICYSGITTKELDNFIRLFTQSYGHKFVIIFYYLKKIGIIYESSNQFNLISNTAPKFSNITGTVSSFSSSSSSPSPSSINSSTAVATASSSSTTSPSETIRKFRHIVKKFNLIPSLDQENYDSKIPIDCGYVFGGCYYPYCCRLLQNLFDSTKSLTQVEEFCRQFHCRLQPSLIPNQHQGRDWQRKSKRIQLILFVGGVTYAEVSAIRFISKQIDLPISIMATSITNGNLFLDSIAQKFI